MGVASSTSRRRLTEATQQGLFGPVPTSGQALPSHPELAERVGDWIVLPKGALQLNYAHRQEAETMLAGGHGGLAEAEMQVPLVSLSVQRGYNASNGHALRRRDADRES